MHRAFRHVLLTRFNLQLDWGARDRRGNTTRDDTWLDHRFRLFTTFCLPSVKAQTCQAFEWYVFFDRATPDFYRDMVRDAAADYDNLVPVYADPIEGDDVREHSKRLLAQAAEIGRPSSDYLLSTRLDNDDVIHRDFIKATQENFVAKHELVLNMSLGYKLDADNMKLYPSKLLSNPFASFIEQRRSNASRGNESFKTVLHSRHSALHRKYETNQIEGIRYWIQVLHDRNLVNSVRGATKPIDFGLLVDDPGYGFLRSTYPRLYALAGG